jgi:ketosteroid isomerase-like protein
MPSRDVDTLQASYDLIWQHHRLDPLQALDPDFEWIVPGYVDGEVKRGPEEVTAFFEEWIGSFDAMEVDYEFREAPDGRVLALVDMRGVGRASGAPTQMRMAQLWTFEDGSARRMVFYDNPAEALADAGLPAS